MKKILPFIALLFISFISNGQSCVWAKTAVDSGTPSPISHAISVATDASGNVYAAGYYTGISVAFGGITLPDADSLTNDIFVVKYNPSGNVIWAKHFGDTLDDYVYSITVDPSGNLYLLGDYQSPSLTFGSVTIANINRFDIYLAKLDSSGNGIWAKSIRLADAPINSQATSVTTDASGNVYITGAYDSSITFGTTYVGHSPISGTGVFVAKYDPSGNALWAKGSDGGGADMSNSISVNALGDVYVTGSYTGDHISFDTSTLINPFFDNTLFFEVKYSSAGAVLWARSIGEGTGSVGGTAIAADGSGNTYVTGWFSASSVTFGSTTLTNADPSGSSNDIFLVKYDATGTALWAKGMGGSSEDVAQAILLTEAGYIYLTGIFISPSISFGSSTLTGLGFFLAKYSTAGGAIWARGNTGMSYGSGTGIAAGSSGSIYVAGNYAAAITLDSITLNNGGSPNLTAFTAKFHDVATGVENVNAESAAIDIYPNPTQGSLTITSPEKINNISVADIMGRELFNNHYDNENVGIDISSLRTGVYLVRVNNTMVKRVVKE